jgi:hypothetical protein
MNSDNYDCILNSRVFPPSPWGEGRDGGFPLVAQNIIVFSRIDNQNGQIASPAYYFLFW